VIILQNNKTAKALQTTVSLLSVLAFFTAFVFSDTVSQGLVFASVCTVFPQGGPVLLKEYVSSPEEKKEDLRETISETKAVSSQIVYEIPEDIKELIKEAEIRAANEKKDGDIKSVTYGEKSATDNVEGILIKNSTEEAADFRSLLKKSLDLETDKEKPMVLLYHTHTTEGYEILDRDWYACDASSRTEDSSRNIVRVGTAVAEELKKAGFSVIHDKTVHDRKYSGSYDRSRETVRRHLEENPQIKVVIDIHRDAIQENDGTKIKAVREINGRKAAQIMIIAGAEGGGKVTDFPHWQENLSFALKLHSSCETVAGGIMRPMMFCYRKYNMDETPYSLLVEFGSEANTLSEAVYSGELFGKALALLLNEYEENHEKNNTD